MIGRYTCEYLKLSGEVCRRSCMEPNRCCYHKKSKNRVSCLECDKGILSLSGRCPDHIRSFYVVPSRNFGTYEVRLFKNFGTFCPIYFEILVPSRNFGTLCPIYFEIFGTLVKK
ncbi:hypothetical protein Glove_225g27 [Diversispora epigaea]|uniref:Uncharacterized protein n=1 Tax=Diversispora epigaea TaxID=1348612 RepID=A0A397IJN3_9GLOM|nr:hypothetical protein Glove_225g27 [Diversispora epigaea]